MALNERGRTGVTTTLAADGVFGVVTQDALSPLHSPGGLTNADGNTAFGIPFTLVAYATHTTTYATQTTTTTFASTDMPFKIRVLGAKIHCVANRTEDFRDGYGWIGVRVQDSDGSGNWSDLKTVEQIGDMEPGDIREVSVLDTSNAVIDENEGLRVSVLSQADSFGTNPTVTFIVELQCLRVI